MRTEDELRRAVQDEVDAPDVGFDLPHARTRVGRRVRRARAVRAGAAMLAVLAVLGVGARVADTSGPQPVRILPAVRVDLGVRPLTDEARRCATTVAGTSQTAVPLAQGSDGRRDWYLFAGGGQFLVALSPPGAQCGRHVVSLGPSVDLAPVALPSGGGDPTNPDMNAIGGAVTKEATAVEILFRGGERRIVPVIDGGIAATHVYLLFTDDEVMPAGVLGGAVVRVTALRGSTPIEHVDNGSEPTLSCTSEERVEWQVKGIDPDRPDEWLTYGEDSRTAVDHAMRESFQPGDSAGTTGPDGYAVYVVRDRGKRVVGSFLVEKVPTGYGVRWAVRCQR